MHKTLLYLHSFGYMCIALLLASCTPQEPLNKDYRKNFEALWKIIDERYCFLDKKGIDWNRVHIKYSTILNENITKIDDLQFFGLMSAMLRELKDGHVNLISSFDNGHYSDFQGEETEGLNIYLRRKFLVGSHISGGMRYTMFVQEGKEHEGSIGYMVYNSFSSSLGNIPFILSYFSKCRAIILDVRDNGGGLVNNADELVSYFIDQKELVGYTSHKIGPGHDDYSPLKPLYIEPAKSIRWTKKPLIVLQDKGSYSATNDFLSKISVAKNVTTVGLRSGGGGGMPAMQELPNGWRVRYSAVRSYDRNKKSIEEGIEPNVEQKLKPWNDPEAQEDQIIIRAIYTIYELAKAKPLI